MSKYVDKVTYTLDLAKKLKGIPSDDRQQALEDIGQYLVEQILESVSKTKTTVKGGKYKSTLSPKYAKIKGELSSSVNPNMELYGDMLDSLTYKVVGNKVEVGIFDYDQAQKADNHNKFSSASLKTKVPQRQFIPNNKNDEVFRPDIQREVNQIIEEYGVNNGSED